MLSRRETLYRLLQQANSSHVVDCAAAAALEPDADPTFV
jgi:hypothetical protein